MNASGMRKFLTIWVGQLVSLVGSGLTSFALSVWIYQQTQSAVQLSLVLLCSVVPGMVMAPFAGAFIDQANRRKVMFISDTGAALATAFVAIAFLSNSLMLWIIYFSTAIISICSAFQRPAYNAAIAQLLSHDQLDQANGLVQIALALSQLIAPVLAGFLLGVIGLFGILLIDGVTFLIGVISLTLVRIEDPPRIGSEVTSSLYQRIFAGLKYIRQRSGLVGLLGLFAVINFSGGIISVLITPMVLSFTSESTLGTILSIGGTGMVLGSVMMSVFGLPKRRMYAILGFLFLSGFSVSLAGVQASFVPITIAAFGFYFSIPFINGGAISIIQSKVETDMQGRVFATLDMVASSMIPIAYVISGPLADYVFEPLLASDGALASTVGVFIGVGDGRGIGLIFIVMGFLIVLVSAVAALYPNLRNIEDFLPAIEEPDKVNSQHVLSNPSTPEVV